MTQPSEEEIAKARSLVNRYAYEEQSGCEQPLVNLENSIARALHDAAKVKAGCVRTDDGAERNVCGTLAITGDNCVISLDYTAYMIGERPDGELEVMPTIPVRWDEARRSDEIYSTKEAAQHAKEAGDGKA